MSQLSRELRANWADPARWTVGVWATLTVSLLVYVLRYGRNAPMWEEWYDLTALYGVADRLDWVFGRLYQHRYVLGRAVMLPLFHLSGQDFRAGMLLSVGLLSASSWVLLRTLGELRGRPHVVDGVVPMLLMNPGGYENLLLGYQIHFTIDVALIALFVRCAALADRRPAQVTAWRVGVLTTLLALGGWVGLPFVPGGAAWVALLVWRERGRGVTALVPPLFAGVYFVWSYLDVQRHPVPGAITNDLPAATRVAAQFASMTLGGLGPRWWPASAFIGSGLLAAVTLAQLSALRDPARRSGAVGVLAVVLAVALMAYGTARHREVGFVPRNIPLLAFVPILALIHTVKSVAAPRPLSGFAAGTVLGLGVAVQYAGWSEGLKAGSLSATKLQMFAADRDAGLPLEYLVSRHQMFPCSEVMTGTRLLRDRGHPFARGVVDPPPCDAVPLLLPMPSAQAVPGDPTPEWVAGRPPVWHFTLPEPRAVTGVRVKLRYPRACERAAIHVLWPKPDGSTGMTACMPWLTPYVWTLDFWVDAELGEFWLRPLSEADAFEVLSAELLVPK